MSFPASVLDVLACPLCRARMSVRAGGEDLVCNECGSTYPILAGVPILVLRPAEYLARFRESVITTLAEFGVADNEHLDRVDAYVQASGPTDPQRFSDDWLTEELAGAVAAPVSMSEHAVRFVEFVAAAEASGPNERVLDLLEATGTVVEIGPGAGVLSRALAERCESLVVADISLRAVMTARDRCFEAGQSNVSAAVLDASDLPLAEGSASAVVAANVIDLVEDPDSFASASHEALAEGGQIVVTTPAPDLGEPGGDDARLAGLLADAGFEVAAVDDGIPWLRRHGPRETQVFFVQLVVANARRLH